MQLRSLLLVSSLVVAPVPAQNLVTNGDFETGVLTPWVAGGAAFNPQLEQFDTTNLGTSWSYGCGPGGSVYAPPHPPNWIQQNVTIAAGVAYEVSCDLAVDGGTGSDFHAGLCYVQVNGVEIGRLDFLDYRYPLIERGRFTWRFTSTTGGTVPLRVNFQRPLYTFNVGTPRMHADNITLRAAPGPTFSMPCNRQMGAAQLSFLVDGGKGAAGAPFALFVSAAELQTGLPISGVSGLLYLDPRYIALVFNGNFNPNAFYSTSLQIPVVAPLVTTPIWFQAVDLVNNTVALGLHQGFTFVY